MNQVERRAVLNSCEAHGTESQNTTASGRKPLQMAAMPLQGFAYLTGMTPASRSLARRAEVLRAQIRHHDELYYQRNRPSISDAAYDRLVHELRLLEERHPELVTLESPAQRVAGRAAGPFASLRHAAPMLSLEATRDQATVASFVTRIAKGSGARGDVLLEPKLDGLSVEVVYRGGVLASAATRGDGVAGEDVTANVRTVESIPPRLRGARAKAPAMLSIRGEMLMSRSAFARMNRDLLARGEEPFANPRNAAAGSLRQLDPAVTARRPLRFVAYEVLASRGASLATDAEALTALRRWGFTIPDAVERARTVEEIARYHRKLGARRERLDYEIDGIVLKANALEGRRRLGETSHHPRWALAWKFEPRAESTIVDDIVFQVGRTGVLTPVALLRPVDVGGVTVSRATLHNLTELARRDVQVGDRVRVHRAGDVIPEIVERRRGARRHRARVPSKCPACRSRLARQGPFLRCDNRWECPAQLIGALRLLARDEAFSITGLGEEVARRLVDAGLVRRVPDLFTLTADDFRGLPGFAAKSSANLAGEVARAKRVDLPHFLVGLGLPGVGRASARALADAFGTLAALRRASVAELDAVRDVGPVEAATIHAALNERRTRALLDGFLGAGVRVRPAREARAGRAGVLAGRRIAFTGTLPSLSRSEASRLAEAAGGEVTASVSRALDYLVAGAAPGTKMEKARRAGVRILDERRFRRLVAGKRAQRRAPGA